MTEDERDGLVDARERRGVVRSSAAMNSRAASGVAESAAHEDLRQRSADAELTLEPRALRYRRGRNVEPRLLHARNLGGGQDGTRARGA